MTRLLKAATALAGAAALLAASAATAFAGEGYAGVGGSVKGESAGGGATLPFTGSDMALYAVIAAGVVLSGLVLRSYAARRVD